ncbi:N-terminal amidase [Colletotrichum orchidophilum]|uniref:N-terminal amidase n=1 Tax=Colletotrichum orchidophilum TaxID=1209926 RepID=A0A1G4B4M5_9PEZI|nr:N-terminal amidase [Colletotrichum orchidophilum]OHE96354.1 N-terminal amidase [Colletotrichum orchidophilum]
MRIGCLQFAPQVGDVDNNLNRADSVLSKANPNDLDILVLPELAFSGYNFKSLQHISPFLEHSGSGITSLWARTTALKYNCNVVVGYPEKVDVSDNWPTSPEYYNSAIVVNGDGETIANYRKTFLYYTDETWALEGQGFFDGFIPGLGNASMGICMDLNPYKFEAPWHEFEFAFHVLECESNVVILSMAWMTREDGRMFSRMPNEPDMDTLTYWVTRLEPLIRSENGDEVIVIFCNRTGIEDEAVYAGTSAVIGIQDGEVKIYGLLGRGSKDLLVVDTNNGPYAKLVHRPEPNHPSVLHGELEKMNPSPASSTTPGYEGSQLSQPSQSQPNDAANTPTDSKKNSPGKPPSVVSLKDSVAARRVRPSPQIQIPSLQNSTGALSLDSPSLPTPTAPSPTPLSIRPKLVIPQSPSSQIWQSFSPVPQSTQSTHSVRSLLSDHSVASNGRAPADSTPYPDSAQPLSGYPRFPERMIYDGQVVIAQGPYSPITSTGSQSPMSPRYFWRPSDTLLKTPMEPRGWSAAPESPIMRHAPSSTYQNLSLWSQHDPLARSHSSNTVRTAVTAVTAKRDEPNVRKQKTADSARGKNSQPPKSRSPSKSRSEEFSAATNGATQTTSSRDATPARPSSPKSRHASRSRLRNRSDSALALREQAVEISQHLENISKRAESVNRDRNSPNDAEVVQVDRPPSPKSRNCSRSRPARRQSSILIAASPSIFPDEFTRPASTAMVEGPKIEHSRSMSRSGHHARSESITKGGRAASKDTHTRARTPAIDGKVPNRPASRTASRGRQPGPVFSPPKMSPSGRPPSARGMSANHADPVNRKQGPSVSNASSTSPGVVPVGFDKIEAVLHPNCPVHGRHSTSGVRPTENAAAQEHNEPFDLALRRSLSTPATANNSTVQFGSLESSKISHNPRVSTVANTPPSDVSSLSETVGTVSTTSRSPSTPFFEPKTPTAMVIIRDLEDAAFGIASPEKESGLAELRCVDRNMGVSAVA